MGLYTCIHITYLNTYTYLNTEANACTGNTRLKIAGLKRVYYTYTSVHVYLRASEISSLKSTFDARARAIIQRREGEEHDTIWNNNESREPVDKSRSCRRSSSSLVNPARNSGDKLAGSEGEGGEEEKGERRVVVAWAEEKGIETRRDAFFA